MHDATELRNILRKSPYIDIKSWEDGLEFAGTGYLEQLDIPTLLIIKNKLDIVIEIGSTEILRNRYDDDPVWIGLDRMKVVRRKDDD